MNCNRVFRRLINKLKNVPTPNPSYYRNQKAVSKYFDYSYLSTVEIKGLEVQSTDAIVHNDKEIEIRIVVDNRQKFDWPH